MLMLTKKYAAHLKQVMKLSENASLWRTLRNFTSAALIFTMFVREIIKHQICGIFTKKEKNMTIKHTYGNVYTHHNQSG